MCPVDKKICFEILKRGLRTNKVLPGFCGSAENFRKFNDPDFQRFAKKHGILPETHIKVWEKDADVFWVFAE